MVNSRCRAGPNRLQVQGWILWSWGTAHLPSPSSTPPPQSYLHRFQLKWSSREDLKGESSLGRRLWKPEVVETAFVLVGMMGCMCPLSCLLSYPLPMGSNVQVSPKEEENFSAWQSRGSECWTPANWDAHNRVWYVGINIDHITNIPLYREPWLSLSSTLSAFTITSEFETF